MDPRGVQGPRRPRPRGQAQRLNRAASLSLLCALAIAAGCGGGSDDDSERQPAAERSATLVAALGDSITAGSPGYDPDPAAREALGFGDDPRSQYGYWAQRGEPRLRIRNCGVFGETTAQIAARLQGCVRGADALVIQGGINDIAQSLGGPASARRFAVNEAAANIGRMTDAGRSLGLRVAVADVLPWNAGPAAAVPSIRRLNKLIELTAKLKGVPVLRFNEALADPGDPDLMRGPLTADGSHPSVAGYRRLGSLVAERFG